MKVADLPDDLLVSIVQKRQENLVSSNRYRHRGRWIFTSEILASLPDVKPKIVMAALRRAARNGRLDGCACGCRGDWNVLK